MRRQFWLAGARPLSRLCSIVAGLARRPPLHAVPGLRSAIMFRRRCDCRLPAWLVARPFAHGARAVRVAMMRRSSSESASATAGPRRVRQRADAHADWTARARGRPQASGSLPMPAAPAGSSFRRRPLVRRGIRSARSSGMDCAAEATRARPAPPRKMYVGLHRSGTPIEYARTSSQRTGDLAQGATELPPRAPDDGHMCTRSTASSPRPTGLAPASEDQPDPQQDEHERDDEIADPERRPSRPRR